MPGIVGMVGSVDSARVAAALKKISYLETYESSVYPVSPTITLGYAGRPAQKNVATQDEEGSRLFVLVYGTVLTQNPRSGFPST